MQFCLIMMQSCSSSIPTSKVKTSADYVVPGFNESAKELHTEARSCFLAWKSPQQQRDCSRFTDMSQWTTI